MFPFFGCLGTAGCCLCINNVVYDVVNLSAMQPNHVKSKTIILNSLIKKLFACAVIASNICQEIRRAIKLLRFELYCIRQNSGALLCWYRAFVYVVVAKAVLIACLKRV